MRSHFRHLVIAPFAIALILAACGVTATTGGAGTNTTGSATTASTTGSSTSTGTTSSTVVATPTTSTVAATPTPCSVPATATPTPSDPCQTAAGWHRYNPSTDHNDGCMNVRWVKGHVALDWIDSTTNLPYWQILTCTRINM